MKPTNVVRAIILNSDEIEAGVERDYDDIGFDDNEEAVVIEYTLRTQFDEAY